MNHLMLKVSPYLYLEGIECKFYVWGKEKKGQMLGEEAAELKWKITVLRIFKRLYLFDQGRIRCRSNPLFYAIFRGSKATKRICLHPFL